MAVLTPAPYGQRSDRMVAAFRCAVAILLAWVGIAPALGADTEYQVKAAFVLNFARFVEWPATSLRQGNEPLIIGIIGHDPFGTAIDAAVAGKKVDEHPLVVKRFTSAQQATNTHLLFICGSEKEQLPEVLQAIRGRGVLTVSDMDGFTERGGMIGLKRRQDMIRFDINLPATSEERLKISGRLFKLADNLHDKH